MPQPDAHSIDQKEINHFETLSHTWWDETGPFKTLHQLNPTRIQFIRDHVMNHFQEVQSNTQRPFGGFSLLDIGCGGGLLAEPMSRLGAEVMGIDAVENNIQIAKIHAQSQELEITYQATTAETLAVNKQLFDIVVCMEVIEHVASVPEFIATCCSLVKPGGILFLSTLNQTIKSFALGIVAAEYILGWVPRGTHQWRKFVRPRDLRRSLEINGFKLTDIKGVHYNLLHKNWRINEDLSVNYMVCAVKS